VEHSRHFKDDTPYARPRITPRIRKARYTLWPEWTMTLIQVLRKRRAGKA
jgi:hypothetical protein